MGRTMSPFKDCFPTTRWSVIALARDQDPDVRRRAVEGLLARYQPAFLAHLTIARRIPRDRAEDLAQSFICDRILQDDLMARADRCRGRLRSFLATALDHHVQMARRHDGAQRRTPRTPMASAEAAAEAPCESLTASAAFDQAWARGVVAQAVDAMRQHCDGHDKQRVWQVFERRLLGPILEGQAAAPYETLAAECGFATPLEAANALVTAKRMFTRMLRKVVEEYACEADVETELRDLRAILACGRAKHL